MKLRTHVKRLKLRCSGRRGRNAQMDGLLRAVAGSTRYRADSLLETLAERLNRKHTAIEVDIDGL